MIFEQFSLENSVYTIFGALIGSVIMLWLTNWKENREAKTRFKNRLICLAHELQINFRDIGNFQNPFQTKALEKLVYEEPLIHKHPTLFQKALKCFHVASILSTSSQSKLKPADGQVLMQELAEFLSVSYNVVAPVLENSKNEATPVKNSFFTRITRLAFSKRLRFKLF